MWPQPGVVSFTTESDATDSDFPSGDPHAGPLGSADSEGLRPHAPTLEKASQPNFSFAPNLKLKIQAEFKTPNSRAKTQSSKLKAQTPNSNRILVLSSFPGFFQRSKYSKSGTQEPSIWLQSEHHIGSFLTRKHPILKGAL